MGGKSLRNQRSTNTRETVKLSDDFEISLEGAINTQLPRVSPRKHRTVCEHPRTKTPAKQSTPARSFSLSKKTPAQLLQRILRRPDEMRAAVALPLFEELDLTGSHYSSDGDRFGLLLTVLIQFPEFCSPFLYLPPDGTI